MKILLSDWKIVEGSERQLDHALKSNWLLYFFRQQKHNLPLCEWEIPSPRAKQETKENSLEKSAQMSEVMMSNFSFIKCKGTHSNDEAFI